MSQSPCVPPLDREAELHAAGLSAPSTPSSPAAQGTTPPIRGGYFPETPPGKPVPEPPGEDDPLPLVADGLALLRARPNQGGRPSVVDDQLKGKMVILLATGLSLRQTAAFLGITHPTVSAAIAADPELASDIASARVRAEVHPLAQILREGGRSWKAAVWLLEYLEKRNERERRAEKQSLPPQKAQAAEGGGDSSRPAIPPLSEREQSRIAAIRAQRPPRKRRGK